MPPLISDDEASDVNEILDDPTEKEDRGMTKGKGKMVVREEEAALVVESDEEDDEDIREDEFVVEAITNHAIDEESGELRFEVKWEGYEKKSDRTWEPEENLETASQILSEYLESVGGKEYLLATWTEKKLEAAEKKGSKKRARASTSATEGTNGSKRGKKNDSHPESAALPRSASQSAFKPPTGSWEDEVVMIDACEGTDSKVVVYLTWKGGHKSQHPLPQVYKRCPQKMLKFYENHLVFKKNDDDV